MPKTPKAFIPRLPNSPRNLQEVIWWINTVSGELNRFFQLVHFYDTDVKLFGQSRRTVVENGFSVKPINPYIELLSEADVESDDTTAIESGSPGQFLVISNVGTFNITIKHDANTFLLNSTHIVMTPFSVITFAWDHVNTRWVMNGGNVGILPPAGVGDNPTEVDFTPVAVGTSEHAALADHKHTLAVPGAPVNVDFQIAGVGTANAPARADHKHSMPTGTPATVGAANAEGSSNSVPRLDHVHAHGSHATGDLHPEYYKADGTRALAGPLAHTGSTVGFYNKTPIIQAAAVPNLTDNSGGTANDTIEAIPNPADSPANADALRDDLVANTLPAIRNNFADLTVKLNAIATAIRGIGIVAS